MFSPAIYWVLSPTSQFGLDCCYEIKQTCYVWSQPRVAKDIVCLFKQTTWPLPHPVNPDCIDIMKLKKHTMSECSKRSPYNGPPVRSLHSTFCIRYSSVRHSTVKSIMKCRKQPDSTYRSVGICPRHPFWGLRGLRGAGSGLCPSPD